MVSPAAIAAAQPHRKGLGDQAADQLAESEGGRMVLRGEISPLQHLAGQRFAAQWRTYLATINGPRWPWRGNGRGNPCDGCSGDPESEKCACALAKRSWERSAKVLSGPETQVISRVCLWDIVCPRGMLAVLRSGLDALAFELGLTNVRKSANFRNASFEIAP